MRSSESFAGALARVSTTAIATACMLLLVLAFGLAGAGAQLTQTPTALAPQTPDTPPVPDRIWTVRVVADNTGLTPSTIVVTPGQKFTIRFENQDSAPADLVFSLPKGPSTFDGPVGIGRTRTATMIAPNRSGVYTFYTTLNKDGSRGMRGQLVVTPTAAGSLSPVFGARDVRIVARDDGYNPAAPFANPGEKLRVTLFNAGDRPHNLTFAFPGGQATFDMALAPGEMRTMMVNVPSRVGQYSFYDPVEGNRDRGDSGSMIVSLPLNPNGPGRVTATGSPTRTMYPTARPTIAVSGATYHIPSRVRAYAHVSRTHMAKRTHAKHQVTHAKHAKHRTARHTTKKGY